MKTLQNTDELLLLGMLKCSPVALHCQESPRKGIASPWCHSVQEPPFSVHVKAEHSGPLLYLPFCFPWEIRGQPNPCCHWDLGKTATQATPPCWNIPWAKSSHYFTIESSVSELEFMFNFTRPPALLKQERTIPAFPKRDWETCSRPRDELWA